MNSYIASALLVLCILVTDIHSHGEESDHSHSDHPHSATAHRQLGDPASKDKLAPRSFMPFMHPAMPNPLDSVIQLWSYDAAEPIQALFNYEGPSKVNLPYRIEKFNYGYERGYIIYNYAFNRYYPQEIYMCTAYVYDAPYMPYPTPYSQTIKNYCEPYYSAPM